MLAVHWLIVSWALGITLSDVVSRRIPNVLSLGAILGGLGYLAYTGQAVLAGGWLDVMVGLLLALLLTLPAYLLRWLGAGDVKLLLAIAVMGGWQYVLTSFVIAGLVSGITTLAMLQYSTYSGHQLTAGRWMPFGAMLATGLIASMGIKW